MGPPPTPQRSRKENGLPTSPTKIPNKPTYLPPSLRETSIPATPAPGQHTSGVVSGRFSNTRESLRPSNPTLPTGGHRTPFISRPSLGGQHRNGLVWVCCTYICVLPVMMQYITRNSFYNLQYNGKRLISCSRFEVLLVVASGYQRSALSCLYVLVCCCATLRSGSDFDRWLGVGNLSSLVLNSPSYGIATP